MFNSTVLEVAIGMCFCYAAVSFVVSSIKEALANILGLRSKTLLSGIQALLNDPNFTGLAKDIYNHALVNPMSPGQTTNLESLEHKPSYIEPDHFAHALIDTLQTVPGDFEQLRTNIEAIDNPQIKQVLLNMYSKADGKLENLHSQISTWFDASMDRLSGKYKRRAQWLCFSIALVIAVGFNIDSIHLFATLWNHPEIAEGLAAQNPQNIDVFKNLPVGWHGDCRWGWYTPIGWLITASTSLFGASFWFDSLQKLTNIRGTGVKPGEQK